MASAGAESSREKNMVPSWIHSIQKSNDSYEDLNASTVKLAETKSLSYLI